MTEATPFLQKYDITFLRPPSIPPELFDEIEGCPFAPRCGRATERCRDVKPVLTPQLSTGILPHLAACHHAEGGTDNA